VRAAVRGAHGPSWHTHTVRRLCLALLSVGAAERLYRSVASGAITIDLGLGRHVRPLGPVTWTIAAPRETVFDVISGPYLERTPRALGAKLQVLERSAHMVLAAHFTDVNGRSTTTVETVRFERPERIHFRLLRGPVPHVVERFELAEVDGSTELTWAGELGTDLWGLGRWWGDRVAAVWERAVRESLAAVTAEAERRSGTPK
jgi:hypothetical protein